jgi:hypothetical protein
MPGISSRCLVRRFVLCQHGRGGQPGVSNSREWERATSRQLGESLGDAKGEGPSRLQLQSALHGSGGSFALATGNRQSAATRGTSNDESGDGLKCLFKLGRGRDGSLRRSARPLPWLEDASVHHARGLAASAVMLLQRACLMGAVLGATSKGSGSRLGCSLRLVRLFG